MGLRTIARYVGISHETVRRIIPEEGLRPYWNDRAARKNYSRWMLRKLQQNKSFLENVLFDESSFSSQALHNRQNTRLWRHRNPNAAIQNFNQGHFSINVCAGIMRNQIIGPIFSPNNLTSAYHLNFLRSRLINKLRRIIPRERRRCIYFMHDGVPPHISRPVRQFLNNIGSRWIGRSSTPKLWPPRSLDLNPLDFWDAVKELVYRSG
ncbi:hypothetical protein WN51_12524 [Melipona quadrifasciata]|uniref:Tc1-like transposase DDE domain-containing protein n=1 Tax=Melipona quadrifasciata TaxID=166423 RepID=A0A0M9A2S0_9HYME|nr:hypothetical protein WN51_12524 [Melipona quadrifasciata]